MPRRAMLPYPSTSRRLCATARCPKVTTIALVSILFACLYNSRTFLSKEQPTLDRVVSTGAPRTVLEPAVEVVKEVVDKSDTAILNFAQRETSDGTQTVYTNVADRTVEDQPRSVGERPTDVTAVSVTDLEANAGQKDLVGLTVDAEKDQAARALSIDTTVDSASGTLTPETVASDAVASEAVDRTENPISLTAAETITAVEKTDEETLSDATTTTLESASTGTVIDSAERTDETESSDTIGVGDGEVPATEKQEVVEETSTATDTVTSQSDPTAIDVNTGVHSVEKQESADEAEIVREDIKAVDSEVVIAEKQKSADENDKVGLAVDREDTAALVQTAEKDVSESLGTAEVDTTDKQETEETEEGAYTTERAEIDPASVTESVSVDGQETAEDGLDTVNKQDTIQSAETDTAEMISDSEKQTETTEEAVNGTEITAAEKQEEVESDTAVLSESEKEKVESADGAEVADLSVTDKLEDEQSTVKVDEDIHAVTNEGDEVDEKEKREQPLETEVVTREAGHVSETAPEHELGTAEKLEGDEAATTQEGQGDYDLSRAEKQGVEVQFDEDTVEKADDEANEAPEDRRR